MNLSTEHAVIGELGFLFLLALVRVQHKEVTRRRIEAGIGEVGIALPAATSAAGSRGSAAPCAPCPAGLRTSA